MKALKQHIRKLTKEQFIELKTMCSNANSLYNCCLYAIKCHFKETGKYLGYLPLYHLIKTNIHYQALNSKIASQIVRLVDKNYRSFFSLLRKKNSGQYRDPIHEPKYRKKNGLYNLILPNDQIKLINGKLKITKNIRIPFSYDLQGTIKQAIIKPKMKGKYYELYLSYEPYTTEQLPELNKNNLLSIDLGINNLASCFSNVGHSFIVNGRPLKSYNQFYNKTKANIQSELEIKNKKKWSNKLELLEINRDNWINNYLNQTVNLIKKYVIKHKISKVICGYNIEWKKSINIGAINNQKFNSIPYFKLKQKLESKLNEIGCEFVLQEESYTSKCSFIDNEEIKEHSEYMGKRIKRGLFRTGTGLLVNSDINGAGNIMRKNVGSEVVKATEEIVGSIVCPVKLNNIFDMKSIHEADSYFSI